MTSNPVEVYPDRDTATTRRHRTRGFRPEGCGMGNKEITRGNGKGVDEV
ncbi:hypothetical protein GA0115233_105014 [Streptomyces sp. DI166]|nr:hypothetical protein GA0115233_105014 [Streptomyces sp. DI166]